MEKEIVTTSNQDTSVREIEVNIAPLLSAIVKKLWLIALSSAVMALVFFIGTNILIKPTYKASFTAFVNNQTQTDSQKSSVNSADLQASRDLVQTYSRILTSNNVLDASAEFINLDMTYEQLSKCVTTQVEDNTQVIRVNVTTTNPTLSFKLAQAIANTAPTCMSQIVEGSSMKIVDAPRAPRGKYGPNYFSAALLGFLAGAIATLVYVLVKYFKDESIKSEGDLEGRYNLPVIGVIPNLNETKNLGYAQSDYYNEYYLHSDRSKKKDKNKKGGKA